MSDKKRLAKLIRKSDIQEEIDKIVLQHDPHSVIDNAKIALEKIKKGHNKMPIEGALFEAMSLNEFKNGILLSISVPERYITFSINMLRLLQKEYSCTTISEQATAELVSINYTRTLHIQSLINQFMLKESMNKVDIAYLAILSKELDRANRHYIMAIYSLKLLKQPALKVNIKTNTAIVGENQLIQANQNVNSI